MSDEPVKPIFLALGGLALEMYRAGHDVSRLDLQMPYEVYTWVMHNWPKSAPAGMADSRYAGIRISCST